MNEITRTSRIATAIQVVQQMNAGMSVSHACKEVGPPRSSFYVIIDRERKAIAKYQDMVITNSQDELLMILAKKNEVLMKLLREALAETTSPRNRLAIYKTITEIQNKLVEELRIHSRALAVQTHDFIGPKLQVANPRFSSGILVDEQEDDLLEDID